MPLYYGMEFKSFSLLFCNVYYYKHKVIIMFKYC